MLVIHSRHYDPASTWAMTPIPAFPEYLYAKLDGDQIRVITDGANEPAKLTSLKLPALKGCCAPAGGAKKLRPEFQAPYVGAAAVLDVPYGKVTACRAAAKGEQYRYDTEIFLNSRRTARISGDTMKERKEIRLRDLPVSKPGVVYLANMPACILDNNCVPKTAADRDGLAHVYAYYAMLQGDTSKCVGTMKKCPVPVKPLKCKTPMFAGGMMAFTFECSNTKYP